MTNLQALISQLQQRRADTTKQIQRVRSLKLERFERRFPGALFSHYGYLGPTIVLPLSFPLIAEVQQFMKQTYPDWNLVSERQQVDSKTSGYIILDYDLHDEEGNLVSSMDIMFSSYREGSTCVINKIGSETVTVEKPIFEIICPEGAEESHV